MISRVASKRRLQALVLEAVAQLDEREQLAGDVAVLAPTTDLVVVELGVLVPERRRLRVLVHVALPAVRGDPTERAAAVDQRDRAADLARELARRVGRTFHLRAALIAPAGELRLRVHQHRVRARGETHPVQDRAQRRDESADRGAGQEARRAREVQPPAHSIILQLPAARDRRRGAPFAAALARHRERLLGAARVRHRERERVGADERRRADLFEHGDRDGQTRR